MSAFMLKMLALITMIIDHVGAVFFPQLYWLRYIGRISMPIYAFLISQGYKYTRNFTRYAIRLAIFAVISEVPYDLLFHGTWLEFGNQSIMFTLLSGLIAIRLLDLSAKKRNIILFLLAVGVTVVPYFGKFDYGIYGVLAILCFYLFQKYRGIDAIAYSGLTYAYYFYNGNQAQLWSVAASIPILLYNGKRGALSLKYFFYIAYPAHLLLLFAVRYVLNHHLLPFT